MKILALELSSGQGSIAWREDGAEIVEQLFANDRKHSGLFFEHMERFSQRFGAADVIVVGLGPGSYAGTRIAIAAAFGLRAAQKTKLIGLPSICAIDTGSREYCVVGDARRQSFFFARVSDGQCIEGPSLYSPAELEGKIRECGVPIYCSTPLPQFPRTMMAFPSAKKLAELAHHRADKITETVLLEPIYLREPHITVPK
ncbi:MAG: tRNA (adenosine(37)-N6)-threonylcarbamoyltransferase complex dimerization subunit type 1 TsaB [Verrucomicrobiota bacterium]